MAKQDTIDFMTAFTIGVTLGVGATLLLRGRSETEAERILRETAPLRRLAAKHARRRRKAQARAARHAAKASAAGTDRADRVDRVDRGGSSRAAVDELRGQVADIIASARQDITRAARRGVRDAWRAAKRKSLR